MGLEELVQRINAEAAEKAANLVSEAKEAAAESISAAQARAESLVSRAKAEGEREVREERLRAVASARLAARRELLLAKEEVLTRYEVGVMDYIAEFVKSDEYEKFLVRAIDDGVAKIGKDAAVHLNSRDRAALKGRKVTGELSKEQIETKGGALVVSADGKRRVDNTIESLLRERSDEIRLRLAEEVFGDGQVKTGD